ncbi:IclR family transcriptional regulator [Lichenibacterium ramalinae]|uniref:IclR family transcriptional regulator n=1 Tax=Lichenibacterium ramalinae TaxID=2316527 RepID=UPI001FE0D1DD|nr:IclR family transcriptional regulator [Lichenibacterium ramalinae]
MSKAVTKAEAPPASERQSGVDRVVDIFEELLRSRAPVRVGELARRLGAPRSTLYNLVNRLVAADLLETTDEDGAVFFGRAIQLYGAAYAQTNPLQRRAGEALDRLAAETDATAQLCALRGNKYVVLDSRNGRGLFRITADVGVPVPLPWTASGRLLLGHLSPGDITALIPPEDYRLPDGRTLAPESFLADVARAREDGHCVTLGLSDRFTCCLAAPVRDARGRTAATLCFVVPVDRDEGERRGLLDRLRAAADALSDPA